MDTLGADIETVELPEAFNQAIGWHRTIMEADLAKSFAPEYEQGADRLSANLREMSERGQTYLAVDYNRAIDRRVGLNMLLDSIFERCDAILGALKQGGTLESPGSWPTT